MTQGRVAQVLKALSIGMLLDLLVTLAVGIILGLIFSLFFFFQGVPDAEVGDRIQAMAMSPGWLTFSVLTGALISTGAGFVAANFLVVNIYPWLGLMGALLTLVGFAGVGQDISTELAMGFSLITLFSVMLGGRIWEWSRE